MYDHFMSDHCFYRQTNFLVSWFEDCPICLWPLVSDCLMRAQISLFSVCAHYWYLEHSTAFQWHSGTSCIVSALERGTPCGLILMHWAVLSKIAFIFLSVNQGYALFGNVVCLFLTTVGYHHSHSFFYALWLVFGGLSAAKLVSHNKIVKVDILNHSIL